MLYNKNHLVDAVAILTYIDTFTADLGITDVQVSTQDVIQVCVSMRQQFPHCDGIENASTFKKVANFVAWFCQLSPIKSAFPTDYRHRSMEHAMSVYNAVNGRNHAMVAKRFGCSERTVYRIHKRMRALIVAKNQHDMFNQ